MAARGPVSVPGGGPKLGTWLQAPSPYLQPVDNQPPEILNTHFTVQEKSHYILSETELV